MTRLGPTKRKDLIRYFKELGFDGPYSGKRHQFMVRDDITVWLPNPHEGDIGRDFLARILRQAGIARDEWEAL